MLPDRTWNERIVISGYHPHRARKTAQQVRDFLDEHTVHRVILKRVASDKDEVGLVRMSQLDHTTGGRQTGAADSLRPRGSK